VSFLSKMPKGFKITVIAVLLIGGFWGVTHYIDSDVLTAKVGLWSKILIGAVLLGVIVWFIKGKLKKKKK
jgi:hypothetical protein